MLPSVTWHVVGYSLASLGVTVGYTWTRSMRPKGASHVSDATTSASAVGSTCPIDSSQTRPPCKRKADDEPSDESSPGDTTCSKRPRLEEDQPSVSSVTLSDTTDAIERPEVIRSASLPAERVNASTDRATEAPPIRITFGNTSALAASTKADGRTTPAFISGEKPGGFAAFASNTTSFSSRTSTTTSNDIPNALLPVPVNPKPTLAERPNITDRQEDVLAARESSDQVAAIPPTGEEDEEVELELKGVKLYIKRGDGEYSEGIFGHMRLLKHQRESSKRVLFRREPLWQASANIRLRELARCTYDAQQRCLRIITKERKADKPDGLSEVVIYCVKRGRSLRSDFADIAQKLAADRQWGKAAA